MNDADGRDVTNTSKKASAVDELIADEINQNGSTAQTAGKSVTSFEAPIYVCEGKIHTPLFDNFRLDIRFEAENEQQTCIIHTEGNMLFPGNVGWVTVELLGPTTLENGQRFELREGSNKRAEGTVSL